MQQLFFSGRIPTGSEAKMCVGYKQCALQKCTVLLVKIVYCTGLKMVVVKIISFYHDEKIARP
jgi:hypothetical protein